MGHEDGYVELEVKGKLGTPNLVIRRLLTARSKGSRFTLNGRAVTGADINQRLVELNVQVSNLWYVNAFQYASLIHFRAALSFPKTEWSSLRR